MDISQDRSRQSATSRGFGAHFMSPVKKRPGKRKTQVMTTTAFDATRKRQRLQADVAALLATELPVIPEEEPGLMESSGQVEEELNAVGEVPEVSLEGSSGQDLNLEALEGSNNGFFKTESTYSGNDYTCNISEGQGLEKKRVTPDQATTILYEKWKATLPLLVDEILAYTTASVGAAIQPVGEELQGLCCSLDVKTTKVTCLYFDRKPHQFLWEMGNSDISLFQISRSSLSSPVPAAP
jgi:hypothetical protein